MGQLKLVIMRLVRPNWTFDSLKLPPFRVRINITIIIIIIIIIIIRVLIIWGQGLRRSRFTSVKG